MNILYCGDKNIEKGLIISVISIVRNCSETVNFYVLTMSLKTKNKFFQLVSPKVVQELEKIIKTYNNENTITLINAERWFNNDMPIANMNTRFVC